MIGKLPAGLLATIWLCAACSAPGGTVVADPDSVSGSSAHLDRGASVGALAAQLNQAFPAGTEAAALRQFVGEQGGGCLDSAVFLESTQQPVLHCFIAEAGPKSCASNTLGIASMLDAATVPHEPRSDDALQVCDANHRFCAADPARIKGALDHAVIQRVQVYRIHEHCQAASAPAG